MPPGYSPATLNLGGVQGIDWRQVGPVCVLTAGFPCQDLSVAGPRTGLAAGTRSGLWRHVVEAIDALNPCLVVIENVRGLLSTRAGTHALRRVEPCPRCMGDHPDQPRMRALGVLLADLADLGYDSSSTCVRASDVGAPHQRARAFLVAWPATPARGAPVEDSDSEPRQQRWQPAPGQTQGREPRTHPGRRGRTPSAHPQGQRRCQGLTEPEVRQRQLHPGLHRGDARCTEHRVRLDRPPAAHPDRVGREGRCGHDPETQGRHELEDGRHSPADWWAEYLPAIRRWEHLTRRPAPPATVPAGRRLSAEFVEWMMGLPKGWVTQIEGPSRAAQLRLLGNSVVPQQVAQALEILLPGPNDVADGCWRRSASLFRTSMQ
ncbi:DNA cytosine methyltransferase [Streptomyces violascens]|uniref:DNA cytosine methyltransferase n=1 Tax=Streptomyces violascens TaxID=67381 RepID=UPI00368CB5EB